MPTRYLKASTHYLQQVTQARIHSRGILKGVTDMMCCTTDSFCQSKIEFRDGNNMGTEPGNLSVLVHYVEQSTIIRIYHQEIA